MEILKEKVLSNHKHIADKTVDFINDNLPDGIEVESDFYETICSIIAKTYILRKTDGKMIFKGASIKSRSIEKFGKEFIATSVRLIMDNKIDDIKYLYRELRNKIIHHELPVEDFAQSKEIKKTPENYLKEKKTTQAWYEMMIREERKIPIGQKVYYYKRNDGNLQFIDQYDKNKPDENVNYLLEKLDKFTNRLYNEEREKNKKGNILTREQYERLFEQEKPQMMLSFVSYNHKDFTHTENGIMQKWLRTNKNETLDYILNHRVDSFCTVQSFTDTNVDNMKHVADLYFDLDCDISSEVKEKITQTDNVSEKFEILNGVLKGTLSDVRKIYKFLKTIGIEDEHVHIFFSGFKGFHIFIPKEVFDLNKGAVDRTYVYKHLAKMLVENYELQYLDMGSIYSWRRMMRLPLTVNSKSGLMKVPIEASWLAKTDDDIISHIVGMNEAFLKNDNVDFLTRAFVRIQEIFKTPPVYNKIAKQYIDTVVEDYFKEKTVEVTRKPEYLFKKLKGKYTECINDILSNGIKKKDDRNKGTMTLASFFKDMGMNKTQAINIITDWALKIPAKYTTSNRSSVISSTKTAVSTIYSSDRYHFSCSACRSLGAKGNSVPCLKSCPLNE